MQIASFLRRVILSSVASLVLPYISTNHWQGTIPFCEMHNPKDLQGDERQDTSKKNIAQNLVRLDCKHTWVAKEKGRCKLSCTLLGIIALWHIYITQEYFTILNAHPTMNEKGWTGAICSDAMPYLQHMKAKDTERQDVEWVHNAVNIAATRANKYFSTWSHKQGDFHK